MTRAPSYLDDNTSTFARTCPGFGKTQAQMALAIEVYRTPLHKRVLWAFCRTGWLILPAVLAVLVFSGCTSDVEYRDEFAQSDELIAVQQEEAARASREFAGREVCGPGARADWQDDKTLVCTPKRGRAYQVAEVTK